MFNAIKKWWRPSKFTVTYCKCFGMGYDRYDKFTYDNFEEAKKRQDYLCGLSAEELLKEGFEFVPNYIRMEQGISPNPIRRLLNRCGSKRLYNVFGIRI